MANQKKGAASASRSFNRTRKALSTTHRDTHVIQTLAQRTRILVRDMSCLRTADVELLSSLGISSDLLNQNAFRVTPQQAHQLGFSHIDEFGEHCENLGGVVYIYAESSGKMFNMRLRLDAPELNGPKYLELPQKRRQRRDLFVPASEWRDLLDPNSGKEVVIVEAEKSALALSSLARRRSSSMMAVATGGCSSWHVTAQSKNKTDPPKKTMFRSLRLLAGRRIKLLFDSNAASNSQVQAQERELRTRLEKIGATVTTHRLPVEVDVNGPDDFVQKHGDEALIKILDTPVKPWLLDHGHSLEEATNIKRPEFVVDKVLRSSGVTIIVGLPSHGKTFMATSLMEALITGKAWLGCMKVQPSDQIVYWVPELSLSQVVHNFDRVGLTKYIASKIFLRTGDAMDDLTLDHPDMLRIVKGADVFLDTLSSFIEGSENDAETFKKLLREDVQGLLRAGARTVTILHHTPKSFETADHMGLAIARGSGDIMAFASMGFGIKKLPYSEGKEKFHIETIKSRVGPADTLKPMEFVIEDDGDRIRFRLYSRPGETRYLSEQSRESPLQGKRGRKPDEDVALREQMIRQMIAGGNGSSTIIAAVQTTFPNVKDRTIRNQISRIARKDKIQGGRLAKSKLN